MLVVRAPVGGAGWITPMRSLARTICGQSWTEPTSWACLRGIWRCLRRLSKPETRGRAGESAPKEGDSRRQLWNALDVSQGRSTFTPSELDQIRRLVREKQVADRDRQKSI